MDMDRIVRGVAALLIAFAFFAAPLLAGGAVAQESTPAAGSLLDELGLPVLEISVSEAGVVAPETFEAGVVLVKVTNTGGAPTTFALVDAPDGITAEMISADLLNPVISDFWLESKAPLVHDVMPGATMSAAVLLEAGSWMIAGSSGSLEAESGTPIGGAEMTVTGEVAEGAADAIEAVATMEFGEYEFVIDGAIPAGPAIVKLTNSHTVIHHAVIFGSDRLYTDEEAHAGVMALMTGSSPTADFMMSEAPAFVTPALAGGGTAWIEVNFEPGFYLAICFIADPGQETPHVMMGMIKSFEVVG
jgi:hypothetical protein